MHGLLARHIGREILYLLEMNQMIKQKLLSIICCGFYGFKKNEEEQGDCILMMTKDDQLEEEEDKKQKNEEKGEEQNADEIVKKCVVLVLEDEENNNIEEKGDDDDERNNNNADEVMVKKCVVLEEEEEKHANEIIMAKSEPLLEEQKKDEIIIVNKGVVLSHDNNEKWIKHYSTCQKILLVGEGDFSFSAALATAFGSGSNIIATSLDSHGFLAENYGNAISNIDMLRRRGCNVIHGVDATKMANHPSLKGLKFDRIIFNFPYAGFFKTQSRQSQLNIHQALMRPFLKNAKEMIGEDGEIHITHKTNGFHREWDITGLALEQGLKLVKTDDFKLGDYPGYNTKRGFGGDDNFFCYPSQTYMFRLSMASC